MPEGHALHRLARLHQRRFAGAPLAVSSPQGRFTDAAVVDGRVLRRASAWGKHLFHHYEGGAIVHVHLGLYGTFRESRTPLREPEVIDEAQVSLILDRLGPDPLRNDADPASAWARITKSRKAIGALLMDQKVLAGVGNVYRSELLFRHGIDPYRLGRDITESEFADAWTDLVELMKVGVRRGRIIVVRPEHDHGSPAYGPKRPRTYVYRRTGEPCRICGTAIRTAEMEGRNLFWCPACQS